LREVIWSPQAKLTNAEIIRYISASDDERSARLVHQRILDAGNGLGAFPTGRPGRVTGTYEKSVAKTSYIILYALPSLSGRHFVLILDVVHMSRNWRKGQMPE
jgi:plasmid stabilization system protein ParE